MIISEINNNKLINALEIVQLSLDDRYWEDINLITACIYSLKTGDFKKLDGLLVEESKGDCGCNQ